MSATQTFIDPMKKPLEDGRAAIADKYPDMRVAWRLVHPDFTSSYGFRWPFPGKWAKATPPKRSRFTLGDACPTFVGDGLCLAKNWSGARSGGIRSNTILVCGYLLGDLLGEDSDKLRVKRAFVIEVVDWLAAVRSTPNADLSYSNLSYSNLSGSDLSYSNLSGSDLSGSDLSGSDLSYARVDGATILPSGPPSGLPSGWKLDGGLVVAA